MKRQFEHPGCGLVRYDVCPFQLQALQKEWGLAKQSGTQLEFADKHSIMRKRSTLGRIRAPWLEKLNRTCTGHHPHCRMSTAAMATYDAYLCEEWARLTRDAYDLEKPILADADVQSCVDKSRPRHERLLINELLCEADWHAFCGAAA